MRFKLFLLGAFVLTACGAPSAVNNTVPAPGSATKSSPNPAPTVTPVPTASTPKNGDYDAKGIVTKINLEQGSLEIDHEEIKDVMPAMKMEFFVSDKKLLDGLKVGDKIDFVLRYKDPTETIVNIKKAQ